VSGQYPSWFAALAAGVTMLSLGMRTRMFARPSAEKSDALTRRTFRRT